MKDVVFNTEAHAFPRFEMGKLFKTGWQRKKNGAVPDEPEPARDGGEQVVRVTHTVQQEVVSTVTRAGVEPTDGIEVADATKESVNAA